MRNEIAEKSKINISDYLPKENANKILKKLNPKEFIITTYKQVKKYANYKCYKRININLLIEIQEVLKENNWNLNDIFPDLQPETINYMIVQIDIIR